MNSLVKIDFLLEAGQVKRLHAVETIKNHTVAEHVYGSLVIATELCQANELALQRTAKVLLVLLTHDAAERVTGDIPAPMKWQSPKLCEALKSFEDKIDHDYNLHTMLSLETYEQNIVKCSDTLDLIDTCVRERKLGNNSSDLHDIVDNCYGYLEQYIKETKGVIEIRRHLYQEFKNGK